jgi:hypothetical protein
MPCSDINILVITNTSLIMKMGYLVLFLEI